MKLSELFNIRSGSSLDLNKMRITQQHEPDTVNFVSRSSKNQGVVARVKILPNVKPFEAGLVTVTLGGSYLLSSFVQQDKFYTAEHMRVLEPKRAMTFHEKLYYCLCIAKNRFKYSSHGRAADRTLDDLELPKDIPHWVNDISIDQATNFELPFHNAELNLNDRKWKPFRLDYIFEIKKGKRITNRQMRDGKVPCIRPISINNGTYKTIDIVPNHSGNTITVSYNGSVGEAFYQPIAHFSLDDINVLYPRFSLNVYIAMFLITLIRREKFRFDFGRKWTLERMNPTQISLPINDKGEPDWQFMEDYIKSLPYSKKLVA